MRAGLITTNTITQAQNRGMVAAAAESGARVVWTVPDHPWVEESGGAAVRVAMTVVATGDLGAVRIKVDDQAGIVREERFHRLNSDLTGHANVAAATSHSLKANQGLATRGFMLFGAGFILSSDEAARLLTEEPSNALVIKQFRNGRDLTVRPRDVFVIDFGLMDEHRARSFPRLFDIVRTRVKPDRDANSREVRRRFWWRFGEPNQQFRSASSDLKRYVATVETSKHRFFVFLGDDVAPDNMLVCISTADAFHLGVLSSSVHVLLAVAAGGRLGVGNDPRYNKTRCFDPFPFPAPNPIQRAAIADVAETLDAHRKDALARDGRVTMTGMYNVLEKLRSGDPLTAKERETHELAACGVLCDLHDALDKLVAAAYGWEWPLEREEILERLVALHAERVEEERRGHVRWLRPEYQVPKFGGAVEAAASDDEGAAAVAAVPKEELRDWPERVIDQLAALQSLLGGAALTPEEAAARFRGAKPGPVHQQLELLASAGEAWRDAEGRYRRVEAGV